jgi:hypothetical protein
MAINNRDHIEHGLALVANGLGPFVDTRMAAAVPDGQDWMAVLAARDHSRYSTERRYSMSDARFLLRVVTEEWRAFKDQLSRAEQSFASELRETGNRWAHSEEFSADDTYRALDTMERLLTAIGAAEQADEVRGLRLGLQPTSGAATVPPATIPARRSGQPDLARSERAVVSWTRVARADVVRAIEEYDRLGQARFLAEHGFGRATAYLLIYHGRSYDSKAILGVAYKFATGVRLGAQDFNGGIYGAAGVLGKLGFEIRNVRDPARQESAWRPSLTAADESVAAIFEVVWDRICRHAGETFTLARGQQFTYEVIGNNVLPVGRQRQLHKGNFDRANARMPLRATTEIKDVQGSSYVFAILTDQRISGNP